MRKIYSLVLMTAMLFIGTNANATVHSVSTKADLMSAFGTAVTGDTIRLTTNVSQDACINLSDGSSLVLDMNGKTIEMDVTSLTPKSSKPCNFDLTHGKLKVIGRGVIRNATDTADLTGPYKFNSKEVHVFYLTGSTTPADSAYTVLEVEKGTFVDCVKGKNAVEVYANSNKAFGVRVLFNGEGHGEKYGIQLSGTVNAKTPENAQFPYFHIQDSAVVYANGSAATACGIYAAGYGKWLIEGYVHGSTGVYIKSGKVEINDAHIKSDNNDDTGIKSGKGSGVDAGGNAIATETNSSYAGGIEITVSGTSTVEAGTNGYAYQDKNTAQGKPSEVDSVVITGGTFVGGAQGCVTIDTSEGDDIQVELAGGTFTGDIETLIENVDDDKVIETVVATDGAGNATVVIGTVDPTDKVVKPVKNVVPTVLVLDSATANSVIKLDADTAGQALDLVLGKGTGTDSTKTDFVAKYLSLNGSATKTTKVTIPAGKKLTVDQIVMNAYGQIVVEAGAQLIVTGANGIFANEESNLILRASESDQALFVIAPTVTGNKQPKATVEYYTTACGATSSAIKWQRLTSPLSVFSSITHNAASLSPTLVPGAASFKTWIEYYDESDAAWHAISAYSQMRAFTSYALTNNSLNGGITYTFKGNVQGNVANNIELATEGWNYMGNPFIAPMHVKSLLQAIKNEPVDGTVWLWDNVNQKYVMRNIPQITTFGETDIPEISALKTYIVKRTSADLALLDIDYEHTIYNYAIDPSSYAAPQRLNDNVTSIKMHIQAANGESDDLYIIEGNNYSDEYESGADAIKLMNAGLNIFAAADDNYAMIASDNVEGTLISMTTADVIDYTITFSNVQGEVYALRDNQTNAIVLMNEGATYNFTAQPNATLDGRFQIVSRQEMPTDVETVEETVNAPKAIYTVMGQYVGETTDWNSLPAGVYVVDGVKVIK